MRFGYETTYAEEFPSQDQWSTPIHLNCCLNNPVIVFVIVLGLILKFLIFTLICDLLHFNYFIWHATCRRSIVMKLRQYSVGDSVRQLATEEGLELTRN